LVEVVVFHWTKNSSSYTGLSDGDYVSEAEAWWDETNTASTWAPCGAMTDYRTDLNKYR